MKTLLTLGEDFNRRHKWLLAAARYCDVALCGGCAAAVVKGRTDYQPKDIDMAATKAASLKFLGLINGFMVERSVHYRIYANSKNDFVPSQALAHFRIQTPFWLPVCLFVIPDNSFRAYRIKGGHWLQLYSDIQRAAEELTEIDDKPRLAIEPEEKVRQPEESAPENDTPEPLSPVIMAEAPFPRRVGSGGRD